MEMDKNRKIYELGSGEHINVNMDFKRFSLPAYLFTPLHTLSEIKICDDKAHSQCMLSALLIRPLQLNVGIYLFEEKMKIIS